MAYAPLLGLFMVRCANGRTLREFVLIEWLLPALFGIVWFTVFGGTILHAQLWEGSMDFLTIYNTQGAEALTLALFDVLPISTIAKIVMLVIITISLVTQCDSMAVTLAGMCMDDSDETTEAPVWMKLFWGTVLPWWRRYLLCWVESMASRPSSPLPVSLCASSAWPACLASSDLF